MAKIPNFVGQQGLDIGNVVQYPTGDPVGAALAGAGDKVSSSLAGAAERLQNRNSKIEHFKNLQGLDVLNTELAVEADNAKKTMEPGAIGLHDKLVETFDKRSSEWLAKIPQDSRPEFEARIQAKRAAYSRSAALMESEESKRFQMSSIDARLGSAKQGILQSGPESIGAFTKDVDELIDGAPSISPIERAEAKKKIRQDLQESGFRALAARNPAEAQRVADGWGLDRGFSGTAQERAMQLLRSKEGFRSSTYWDVNAERVGYGSDTITDATGNVRAVKRGDTVSKEDAERDLRRRSGEFMNGVRAAVGEEAFARLNPNQQAALTSVAYNYGSLPGSVAQAARTGNAETLARSIEGLQSHNEGVNRGRRLSEAALVRSAGGDGPVAGVNAVDERFKDIPAEKRLQLAAGADLEARKMDAENAVAIQKDYQVKLNDFKTRIIDNQATLADVDAARKEGWLTDADHIRALSGQIAQRDKGMADTQNFHKAMAASDFVWNPLEKDHKDMADAGFAALGGNMPALQTIAERSGIVPATAAVAMRGAMLSPDANRVQSALQTAKNLVGGKYPNIFAGVDGGKDLTEAALTFREYVDGRGMTAADATRKFMEDQTPELDQKIKAKIKKEDVDAVVKKNLSDGDIRSAFDPSFLGLAPNPQLAFNPEMRRRAMGDYETAFRDHFQKNGDVSLSKTLALAEMKRTWGVTQVTGSKVVMKYPPDRAHVYSGVEDPGGLFAKQAISAIKEWNGIDVARSNLVIAETRHTAERYVRGDAPTYTLGYTDKAGLFQVIPRAFFADPTQMRTDQTEQRAASFVAGQTSFAQADRLKANQRMVRDEARQRIQETRREAEGSAFAETVP